MEGLEAEHWPRDALDETMILLNDIVEVFGLNDVDDPTISRKSEDGV